MNSVKSNNLSLKIKGFHHHGFKSGNSPFTENYYFVQWWSGDEENGGNI